MLLHIDEEVDEVEIVIDLHDAIDEIDEEVDQIRVDIEDNEYPLIDNEIHEDNERHDAV